MAVTVEDALLSGDPSLIKRFRGSIATQISSDVNLLGKELSKMDDENLALDSISHNLINIQKEKLLAHFKTLQTLHDRYISLRIQSSDDTTEQDLVQEDVKYMEDKTFVVCPILDNIEKYENALSAKNKMKDLTKSLNEAKIAFLQSKKDFMVVYNISKSEIDRLETFEEKSEEKTENIMKFPTEALISNLLKALDDVRTACKKCIEVCNESEMNTSNNAVQFSYEEELTKYTNIEIKLKTYEQIKINTKINLNGKDSQTKAVPLKIKKPDNLMFSGLARDFAAFKRDFLAIVVPNRDNAQIGVYLKQAIPKKYTHLISNKDLHDWQGMLTVIQDELATPKMVVDQTVGELEKMRIPASDKAFVELVDSLERIERDLASLNQLGEIANTSILSKLEAKLPSRINQIWTKKVVEEKLLKKTSQEKFAAFMHFLKEAKEMTRYNLCRTSKYLCFVTGERIEHIPSDISDSADGQYKGRLLPCLACKDDTNDPNCPTLFHNMRSCRHWGSLSHRQRIALVNCVKHPFSPDNHSTEDCSRDIDRPCLFCKKVNEHSYLLCPDFQPLKKGNR